MSPEMRTEGHNMQCPAPINLDIKYRMEQEAEGGDE